MTLNTLIRSSRVNIFQFAIYRLLEKTFDASQLDLCHSSLSPKILILFIYLFKKSFFGACVFSPVSVNFDNTSVVYSKTLENFSVTALDSHGIVIKLPTS